jgi:hypothetical protein
MTNPNARTEFTGQDPCRSPKGWWPFPRLTDVRAQVQAMHEAATTLLSVPSREAFWCQSWESSVFKAAGNEASNREKYYLLRFTALFSVLLVSTSAAISVAATGVGAESIRMATFILSLIAALSTGAISIFRPVERWMVYRKLLAGLLEAGWTLIASIDAGGPSEIAPDVPASAKGAGHDAWAVFRASTEALQRKYEKDYVTFLIAPGMEHSDHDDAGSMANRPSQKTATPHT